MRTLQLAVKREYFEQIKSGEKKHENRLRNDYWSKRLCNRDYDRVVITLGYPSRDDHERILTFPWHGYISRTIIHKHFGDNPVDVFAIILEK